jgi:tetratricopeptide (TPR) repeat protein/thiol-disulfide isomerase/thioredoxin
MNAEVIRMVLRCLSACALATALLCAQPVTVPHTEADAQVLEKRLEANAEDLPARMQLIIFYSRVSSLPADRARPLRRQHVLWMIEHHADHTVLHDFGGFAKSGNSLADPDAWSGADRLWRARFSGDTASSPEVYVNAIAFYRVGDRAFASQLAARGLAAYPGNARIAEAKGALLAYTMLDVKSVDQYNRPSVFDDDAVHSEAGAAARQELESAADANLAGGAAYALVNLPLAPSPLHDHSAGIEATDQITERLFQRAIELEPGGQRWKSGLASFYWTSASRKQSQADKIALYEKSLDLAGSGSPRTYVLPQLAEAYYSSGNLSRAAETANQCLTVAADAPSDPNHGGLIHTGNIVLGRMALKQGNLEEAKRRLIAAGKTTSTPVLSSFGPNWILAQDLLSKGERDTVLAYIDLCRDFWKLHADRLDRWAETIRGGGTPNFSSGPELPKSDLLGKPAPEFRLKTLAGSELALSEFNGKVVLLDFWATWCAPCRAEMPAFEKLHKELGSKDVAILALDANEPEDTVAAYIKKEKYTFPVLLSEGTSVVAKYNVHAFPTTLALDKTGRVAEVIVGSGKETESRLREAIERARNGAPPPPPAESDHASGTAASSAAAPSLPPAVTAEDFFRDAFRMHTAHDYSGALTALNRAIALRKDWVQALSDRADCYSHLKRYNEAIADLNDVIRLDPKRTAAYNQRGLAYANSNRHAEAVPDYTRAIELGPTSMFYNNRGWAYLELGRLDEAAADLNTALDLGPSNDLALGNRSRLFMMRKQYPQAIADCDAALRLNPNASWAVSRKADAQRSLAPAPSAVAAALPAPKLLSPDPGAVFDHYPRQTTLVWAEVAGAASYVVEWDYKDGNTWWTETHGSRGGILEAPKPVATFQFVGAQAGRWRVWALDSAGHPGPKTEWREFRYTR